MPEVKLLKSTVVSGERHVLEPGKPKVIDCSDADARYLINTKRAEPVDEKPKKPTKEEAAKIKKAQALAAKERAEALEATKAEWEKSPELRKQHGDNFNAYLASLADQG